MFFLLCRQKDIDKIIEGNDRNYVIDKLTCEIIDDVISVISLYYFIGVFLSI